MGPRSFDEVDSPPPTYAVDRGRRATYSGWGRSSPPQPPNLKRLSSQRPALQRSEACTSEACTRDSFSPFGRLHVAAQPVLFTAEFRKKMAQLPQGQRQEWFASLTSRFRDTVGAGNAVFEQELREVARGCRLQLVESIARQLGPFDPRHLRALLEVPRERFVR